MKILCVINSLRPGGAQRQLVNLAIGFKEKGHEISILAYHNVNFYQKELIKNHIDTTFIVEANYLKRFIEMRKFIRNGNYNSVLSFLEAPCFISTLSGFPFRNWRLVVGERSADPSIYSSFKRRLYRWIHLFADYLVSNSQTNLDMVREINPLLPSDKCRVIYNMLAIGSKSSHEFSTNLLNDKFKILILANQRRLKNLEGLVEAVYLLSEDQKLNLRIDWYGERDLNDFDSEAMKRIKELDLETIFFFHKPIENVSRKILDADAIGLFSHYEGFPNVICEAMMLSKPIICTTISDIPLLLKEGINGFFCESDDNKSISSAIKRAMNADTEQLKAIGKSNEILAMNLFNKEKVVNAYLELLNIPN